MKFKKCKWCENPVLLANGHECNNCWELYLRIKYDLEIAKTMIQQIEENINEL